MIPRLGKGLMVRIRYSWQTMFKRKNLLLTNTLIGGGLMAIGDCLLQNWEIQTKPDRVYDWKRTGRMLVSGLAMGPPMHYWYAWMDKRFVGTTMKTVGKKVLLDQIISSPAMMFGYLVGMEVMEGHSLYDGLKEFKGKFWELYRADLCVWPASQIISFYFLSPKYRVMYINCISFGWDTYMCYIKHRDDGLHPAVKSDSSAVDVQQKALPASNPLEEKASKLQCETC